MTSGDEVSAKTQFAASRGQGGELAGAVSKNHRETRQLSTGIGHSPGSRFEVSRRVEFNLNDLMPPRFECRTDVTQGQILFAFRSDKGSFHTCMAHHVSKRDNRREANRRAVRERRVAYPLLLESYVQDSQFAAD